MNVLETEGVIVLPGALALSLVGIGLMLYSARMTRLAVLKRVVLINPDRRLAVSKVLAAELIRSAARGSTEREAQEMTRLVLRMGIPAARAGMALGAIRAAGIIVLAVLGGIFGEHWLATPGSLVMPLLLATAGALSGWFVPVIVVRKLVKARTKEIVAGLPDALELLVICVEAGLSFEEGINRVSEVLRVSRPAVAEELALTSADLKILPSHERALGNLAQRVDAPSVRTVVTTLSQTLRYGTPLAQGLRVISAELRTDALVRLEERANQLPSLMTIPMMLFILPTIFMIVAGPAALHVMDVLKH
jgi:tight adherence protein C